MTSTLTRTFQPNENDSDFLDDLLGFQSPSNSKTSTQARSQDQFIVRDVQVERLGRSSLLHSQPPPPSFSNQGGVQQGNVDVQVSSSHVYLQQEKGFPAEMYWQVKRHVKEIVENPYENTFYSKIQKLRDTRIMFWQRIRMYVRYGWMRSLVVIFGLVGKKYKRAGTILYEPVMASNGRYL